MKDSKRIAMELTEDYVPSDMLNKELMINQLHLVANEDGNMKDRILEVGIKEIVKQCRKQVSGREDVDFDNDDIPYSKASLEKVKHLRSSNLYVVYDIKQENGKRAVCFVYHRENGKYINLMMEADGSLYLSEEY